MAITRAQQAKQMLQNGGMLVQPGFGGTRQGYRGEAAAASDAAAGRDAGRSDTGSASGRGDGPASSRDPTKQFSPEAQKIARAMRNEKIGLGDKFVPDFFPTAKTFANRFQVSKPTVFDRQRKEFVRALGPQVVDTSDEDRGGPEVILPVDTTFADAPVTSAPVTPSTGENLTRIAYRLMADGGAVIDEEPRQAYGLGSIVKKATRAVKKVAKSPIGKAAIAYTLTGGLGNLAQGQGFFTNFMSPTTFLGGAKSIFTKQGLRNIAFGAPGKFMGPTSKGYMTPGTKGLFGVGGELSPFRVGAGIAALSALPLLGVGVEEEEEEKPTSAYLGEGLDIAAIRANPRAFQGQAYRLMAEGGDTEDAKEPVAKKVMPLIDMDGKEKDYRETGGFVDIGRMEKADDVPARLSKNEFVFTADAVRNAGDGSVDKGAEVMYNMMKNLESGGDVSEESQGLEGARKMFQTSQRLEEVL